MNILVSILLIIIGAIIIIRKWRIVKSINDDKVNRDFETGLSLKMKAEEAKEYRIINGTLFSMGLCGFGFLLMLGGFLQLFGFGLCV